jgi:hypothetical protein
MTDTPGLRVSVALSVEPFLQPNESYASRGKAGVAEAISALRGRLAKEGLGSVFVLIAMGFSAIRACG